MSAVPERTAVGEVAPGDALPVLHRTATRLTLFLFGVAYWTSHRIHYDLEAARAEGFDDVLVTANLLSAYNVELLTRWTGDPYCLLTLEERNVAPAFADEPLTVTGRVLEVGGSDGGRTARCSLLIAKNHGTAVVSATATVLLPQYTATHRKIEGR
jgi:hydroxyacyl-ACP dehydratase HTD2-like protein with hotdog domain